MLALEWLKNAHGIMEKLEATQLENIKKAATVMADSIEAGRWVHTFGCGHATIPVEEMYPRIGSFVGFHPLCELPLTFFTQIIGQMGIHQFLFLERAEGYGQEIMKNYDFDSKDCMWIFSHTGINAVNIDMALEAKKRGITMPYKPSTWDQIPGWAKDPDGHWCLAYTGTVAFIINKELVKDIPRTWSDLLKGTYRVSVGAVGSAAQANYSVLAAAIAFGGDEKNLNPAYDFFAKIAKQGRLSMVDPVVANLEKGEVEVGMLWDFNALNYRDQIDRNRFEVVIPSEGSVMSGYTTILNKYSKHPNAAKFTREFILSDEGQINLAGGYARPIRIDHIKLPEDVAAKMLPSEQYAKARPVKDFAAWTKTTARLSRNWQSKVSIHMK